MSNILKQEKYMNHIKGRTYKI